MSIVLEFFPFLDMSQHWWRRELGQGMLAAARSKVALDLSLGEKDIVHLALGYLREGTRLWRQRVS